MTIDRTSTNQQHYRPPVVTDLNVFGRHDAAHQLAGLEPPTRGAAITDLLDAEPTADGIARQLAEQMLSADDPEVWLEEALDRIARAHAADALRTGMGKHRDATVKAHSDRLTTEAAEAIRPAFGATVKTLTKAAAKLPAGDHPLDLEAVVELDVTKEMKTTMEALAHLAVFAGIHRTPTGGDVPARAISLLPIVAIPDSPVAEVNRLTRVELVPDETRDDVRRFMEHVVRHGVDRALIGVARGEYPTIEFRLAATPQDVWTGFAHLRNALTQRGVDTNNGRAQVA